jgi:hypothetical protein
VQAHKQGALAIPASGKVSTPSDPRARTRAAQAYLDETRRQDASVRASSKAREEEMGATSGQHKDAMRGEEQPHLLLEGVEHQVVIHFQAIDIGVGSQEMLFCVFVADHCLHNCAGACT